MSNSHGLSNGLIIGLKESTTRNILLCFFVLFFLGNRNYINSLVEDMEIGASNGLF